MKTKILTTLVILFTLFLGKSYAALEFTKAPKLIGIDHLNAKITWEEISGVKGYYVYISKSGDKDYKPYGELYNENYAKIGGLEPSTKYNIKISYLNKDGKESDFSPKLEIKTRVDEYDKGEKSTDGSNSDKFLLEKVNVLETNKLELIFSNKLEDKGNDSVREFRILKGDEDIANVKTVSLDGNSKNKLILNLDRSLQIGEYKVSVIYLKNSKGESIKNGINSILNFSIKDKNTNVEIEDDEDFVDVNVEDKNTNVEIEDEKDSVDVNVDDKNTNVEIKDEHNSADEIKTNEKLGEISGEIIHGVASNEVTVAEKSEKLPKGGPEHLLILFIAGILSFLFIRKKSFS